MLVFGSTRAYLQFSRLLEWQILALLFNARSPRDHTHSINSTLFELAWARPQPDLGTTIYVSQPQSLSQQTLFVVSVVVCDEYYRQDVIHIRRSATTARADQHQYWLLFTFLFRFGLATTHNIIYPHKHIFCFSIFSVPYIHTHTSVGQASCGANNGFCLHGHARYCSIFLYGSRR